MKKEGFLLAAIAGLSLSASATSLDAADYCDVTRNAPVSVREMRPLADGKTYAMVSDDGRRIDIFSYLSGKRPARSSILTP